MKLTADMLREAGVHERQVMLFEQQFPDGCEPTEELCVQHPLLHYDWFAEEIFSPEKLGKFQEALDPFWHQYEVDMAKSFRTYRAGVDPHWAKQDFATREKACRSQYSTETAQHLATYQEARARAFGRIWSEQ